jgi:hypothetical protein
MVCWTAIRLLRDDPVASLVGSLASSASCLISRKPRCFPRRSIVVESSSSTERILHCTQNLGGRSRNKSGISCSLCSFSTKSTRRKPSLPRPISSLAVSKQQVARVREEGHPHAGTRWGEHHCFLLQVLCTSAEQPDDAWQNDDRTPRFGHDEPTFMSTIQTDINITTIQGLKETNYLLIRRPNICAT